MTQQKAAPAGAGALQATVPQSLAGQRLDRVLGRLFGDYSRTRLQRWVRDGRVQVDGVTCRDTRVRVDGGEHLRVEPLNEPAGHLAPQAMALVVVHRDEHLLVLDKPAGLVVHPGAGNPDRTLANALVHLYPGLASLPRAGLVHRLDKDTTGLMVVARTLEAQTRLVRLIAARQVHRGYEAVVHGIAPLAGKVDAPIGRHRVHRTRMAVRGGGRPSRTRYRRLAAFRAHSHLALELETGRTHQIRVHMAHLGHPLVGDRDYGGLRPPTSALGAVAARALRTFPRQALHARRLAFRHPLTGEELALESSLPGDFAALVACLAADAAGCEGT
jgi:23S rRNA pseudouridine1911/1915/1917 synthase